MRKAVSAALLATVMMVIAAGVSADKPTFVTLGTSGSGGTYGLIGAAMAKVLNQFGNGVNVTVEATPGGGLGNVRLLGRKRLDFGIATVDNAVAAYEGIGPFEKEQYKNIRLVLFGTDLPFHVVVPGDSPIRQLTDLKGKTLVTNSAANATMYIPETLSLFGLRKDVDYKLLNVATTEAIEAFKDGRVHAFVSYLFMPVAALLDLTTTRTVRFLAMDEAKRRELTGRYTYYGLGKIPAKTYPGQDADIPTTTITGVLLAREEVPKDVVYRVTKALLEHTKDLQETYAAAGTFSLERQASRLKEGKVVPPWHPGAEQYFKERGLVK